MFQNIILYFRGKHLMKKLSLYLETSIFGFYFEQQECNRLKREATRKLFSQIMEKELNGYISER